jgi:NADH dehydrogenase (ubiquinone) Fe-S protein 1
VRFVIKIVRVEDLDMFSRGLKNEIGTYVEKFFQTELFGNVIDLYPVGVLTSKLFFVSTAKGQRRASSVVIVSGASNAASNITDSSSEASPQCFLTKNP